MRIAFGSDFYSGLRFGVRMAWAHRRDPREGAERFRGRLEVFFGLPEPVRGVADRSAAWTGRDRPVVGWRWPRRLHLSWGDR
jgi:hypothetical protein